MIYRESPIKIAQQYGKPVFEDQAGWRVLQTMPLRDNPDICVCDLSHRPKSLVLGTAVDEATFPGVGKAAWRENAWYVRLSPGEAHFYDLFGNMEDVRRPEDAIDMTDAWALVAVYGPQAIALMNRLVAVDTDSALIKEPLFMATRTHNARVHILNTKSAMGFLIACDRSYGHDVYESCFHVPHPTIVRPAGAKDFHEWLESSGWFLSNASS
jgi:hypothetical protein